MISCSLVFKASSILRTASSVSLLLGGLGVGDRLPADIANRDTLLLRVFSSQLDQIPPPILRERWDWNAQVLSFDHRVQS
jgi:hypothetical protein